MKNSDNISIYESYKQKRVVHYYLSEQEAAEAQATKKLEQALQAPETEEAILKNAQELFAKYNKQIEAAKIQGKEAIDSLLKQIEDEQKQTVKKESLELQEEGWWDRMKSRGAGALRQGQELMKGGSGPTKGYDTHKVLKRFEILQNSIGKDLKELERDLGTTSTKDDTVKQQVTQMIQTLGSQHSITPVQSKLGDIRHKVGVLGQNVVTGAALGIGALAIAAPIIASLGITGPAAAAVGAGVSAASTSALKDLIYGQNPNIKRAAIAGAAAATAAGFIRYYLDGASSAGVGKAAPTVDQTMPSPVPAETAEFAQNPQELFQAMNGGPLDPASSLDNFKSAAGEVLRQQGIIGSSGGNNVPSPIVYNFISKLAKNSPEQAKAVVDYIARMPKEQALDLFSWKNRESGAAIETLQNFLTNK
jgi:hypothetical protein